MAPRTNYVLIDFENVQPEAMSMLDHEHFKVLVFVGATPRQSFKRLKKGISRHTPCPFVKLADCSSRRVGIA